jgi:hypothetical protein
MLVVALIQIRDVPDHIYRKLVEQAGNERRSIAQQAVALLARGLEIELNPKVRRRKVLEAIHSGWHTPGAKLSDPAKLIREDRSR